MISSGDEVDSDASPYFIRLISKSFYLPRLQVIAERERNRRAWSATERLLKSGIEVRDVFGRLAGEGD